MPPTPDETCHPSLSSWVPSTRDTATDFPIQNLPFGVIASAGPDRTPGIGVAIGHDVLDLHCCLVDGLFGALAPGCRQALTAHTLNALLALGSAAIGDVRRAVQQVLREDAAADIKARTARHLIRAADVQLGLPVQVGDFTDCFASLHHATRVARLRTPDAAPPAHYAFAPLAYHGRAGTIVPTDTPLERPFGPAKGPSGPRYAPTARLDYEAELGLLIAGNTPPGVPLSPAQAREHIGGVCLVNDWSARDVQAFEAQPLGPFLSKSFATTLGGWMVTPQALAPFRQPLAARPADMPPPLPHLIDDEDGRQGAWAITVEVTLRSRAMRALDLPPVRLSTASAASLFWTPAQLVSHQTSNGCRLRAGDLVATGTISGPDDDARSTLVERTHGGRELLTLPSGESRAYLHDGDEVVLRAWCDTAGAVRIGFGECRGEVVPARTADGGTV